MQDDPGNALHDLLKITHQKSTQIPAIHVFERFRLFMLSPRAPVTFNLSEIGSDRAQKQKDTVSNEFTHLHLLSTPKSIPKSHDCF